MTFGTGNPIGSTNPKDLKDNAYNLDLLLLGPNPSYPDRLGVPRKSWKGLEVAFDSDQVRRESEFDTDQAQRALEFSEFLENSGFETPVDYVAALGIIRPTQIVRFGGELYRAHDADLPFTTTTWAADEVKFFAVGDAVFRQELSEPTGAKMLGHGREQLNRSIDSVAGMLNALPVNLWEFAHYATGYVSGGDPETWIWTPAIQAALDFAASDPKRIRAVYAPGGNYLTGLFYVPRGVDFYGDGSIENGLMSATRFIAAPGLNQDVMRFKWQNDGGARRFWFGAVRRMAIFGDVTNASGWGISLRADDGVKIAPQDTSVFEDLIVRRCPSGGMEFPDGALPLSLNRVKLLWNGGPGLHITGGTFLHQSLDLMSISGDGNGSALIKLSNLDGNGSVNIYNTKSERRINSDFGTGAQQPNAIWLENCDKTPINVFGGTHISSIPAGGVFEKPGSFIRITGGLRPVVSWFGLAVRVRPTDTGADPAVLEDPSGAYIPYTRASGRYGASNTIDYTQSSAAYRTFGPVNAYQSISVEATGDQVAGVTPGRSFIETDVGVDAKVWLEVVSGSQLTRRCVNDAGTVTNVYERVNRSGAVPTSMDWLVPVRPHVLTISALPAASSFSNAVVMISNPAAGKGRMVYSDGSIWRYVSDDSAV